MEAERQSCITVSMGGSSPVSRLQQAAGGDGTVAEESGEEVKSDVEAFLRILN